jgi:hypothetical protein
VLTGGDSFTLGPGESDTWIVSLGIPAQARAGDYVARVAAMTRGSLVPLAADSLLLTVTTRRGISLTFGDRPSYVIAGTPYKVSLLVGNRGNAVAVVRVTATTPGGDLTEVSPGIVTLQPGEARRVTVRVDPDRDAALTPTEAMVEVRATDSEAPDTPVTVSARMTTAQGPGAGDPFFATVPAQLRVRPANTGGGVAPFEITGGGALREGGAEQIDFTFRGSPGRASPFGEREEYRINLRAPRYRVLLGDNFYALSSLTSRGQAGFGGGVDYNSGLVGLGGYSQRFRFERDNPDETGFSASLNPRGLFGGSTLALNGVERTGGPLAGRIVGSTASFHPLPGMLVETELARSQGSAGKGSAQSLRVSGGRSIHYDAAHVAGSAFFAGPARGAEDDYATLAGRVFQKLDVSATGTSHRSGQWSDTITAHQRSRSTTLGGTWDGQFSLEYSALGRRSEYGASRIDETDRLVRTRFSRQLRAGSFWASADIGRSNSDTAAGSRPFSDFLAGASLTHGSNTLSAFADLYNGRSASRGQIGSSTLGGSASLSITRSIALWVNGYAVRYVSGGNPGYTQFDGRLTRTFPNGATLGIRARISTMVAPMQQAGRIAYLEYGMPLRIPVGRLRPPGTVSGTVFDAASGLAVSGALVRLGSAAALSDADGRVSFRRLPTGEYRVAVVEPGSSNDAIVSGDTRIVIDSPHPRPAPFRVRISRGASVSGRVVQLLPAKSSLNGEPDSLEAPSALENVSVALVAARDTIFRATDSEGKYSFTDVPGGEWTVAVITEAPPRFHYERENMRLTLRAGESAVADFQLIPRKREIRLLQNAQSPVLRVPEKRDH